MGDDAVRECLYSEEDLPDVVATEVTRYYNSALEAINLVSQQHIIAFLSHAFGHVSSKVQYEAMLQWMALTKLGNPSWDFVYGTLLPTVSCRIRKMLQIPLNNEICTVQFGHNSHELVLRLLSCLLDRQAGAPLRLLTSDTEFYSMTRQLNRLLQSPVHAVQVDVVQAEPAATFASRLLACAAGKQAPDRSLSSPGNSNSNRSSTGAGRYDMVYVSHITYLTQQTLLPEVADTVAALWSTCSELHSQAPLIVVDGYHGFGAIPTDLSAVADKCYYVSGLLKHIGCGPNCAFMTAPSAHPLRPLFTGWLADISVLLPGSAGIGIGSEVGYDRELALHGSTAGFMLPLLTFNSLIDVWELGEVTGLPAAGLAATTAGAATGAVPVGPVKVSVAAVHGHVMELHDRFLEGVKQLKHPVVNTASLVNLQKNRGVQSHTLVFQSRAGAAEAARVVAALQQQGCLVDCRKEYVRVGFGFNHSVRDVERLVAALRACSA